MRRQVSIREGTAEYEPSVDARRPAVDQVERATKPGLLLLLLVCLVARSRALIMLPGEIGRKAVSSTIAVLAIFGVFGLLMYAFGLLQFAGRAGAAGHHEGDRGQQSTMD